MICSLVAQHQAMVRSLGAAHAQTASHMVHQCQSCIAVAPLLYTTMELLILSQGQTSYIIKCENWTFPYSQWLCILLDWLRTIHLVPCQFSTPERAPDSFFILYKTRWQGLSHIRTETAALGLPC